MEAHVFNASNAKHYKNILSGGYPDKYVYNSQDGNGIGGFFGPIMKAVVPVVKMIGKSLLGVAKPAGKALAREAIKGASTAALGSLVDKTADSIRHSKKRKTSRKTKRVVR